MVRRVFFSFHYERDVWRAAIVRNHWVSKEDRESAGYFDSVPWEEVKTKGEPAIKKWIADNLKGTSVTVVLIGAETSGRKWVRYEIQKSLEKGNDIIGIHIHNIKDQYEETDWAGDLDFGLIDGERTFSELFPVYDWVNDKGYENFADWIEDLDSNARDKYSFWDALATVAIVGLVVGAISALFKPRCRYCNVRIDKGVSVCPNCGRYLNQF